MKKLLLILFFVAATLSAQSDFFVPILWKLSGTDLVPTVSTYRVPLTYLSIPTIGTAANNLVQLTAEAKLPGVDGSLLLNVGYEPTTTVEVIEDFVGGTYTTNNIGNYGWRQGGLGQALDAVVTTGRIGIVHISTDGANANRGTWINLNQVNTKGILLGTQGYCTSIFSVRNAQAIHADVTLRVGLVSQGVIDNDDAADGIYFRSSGTGNWYAVTRKVNTETTTDTGVAQSTSFLQFKIISNADGSSIGFYIAGSLVATHTTNIPIVAIGPFFQITSASTTAYSLDADYFYLKITGLTR